MSKWAGLAGLRVGYGIMNGVLVDHIMDIKPPYNVNIAAEAAAIASLEDSDYLLGNVRRIVDDRESLYAALEGIPGIKPWPSYGNYILCQMNGPEQARDMVAQLADRGVFVRKFGSDRLADCFRVAIGTETENRGLPPSRPGDCPMIADPSRQPRTARIERNTAETRISLSLNIDGTGEYELDAVNGMFEHLLAQLSRHGLIDLTLSAEGDTHVGIAPSGRGRGYRAGKGPL